MRHVTVRRSAVIDAPIDAVWAAAHDPAVPPGAVRTVALSDGGTAQEQVLAVSAREHEIRCVLETPVLECIVTTTLRPVTDGGRCLWLWQARMRTPPDAADGTGAFAAALAADELARLRGAPTRPAPPHRQPAARATTADAILVTAFGGPDVLRWSAVAVPPPGPGEVTIRHTAIGVNFIDIHARTGTFRLLQPPAVPGMEAAGLVEVVGPDVVGLRPGDRVGYACAPVGAYATRRTMPAELVLPLPDHIDDTTAAAVLLKGMTAEFLLHRIRQVRPGETILVHAAAGATGLLLCQWAAALGAVVIGTVSTEAKARLAGAHGCAYPLLAGAEEVAVAVRRITGGRGCDAVYDGIGGDQLAQSYAALAIRGHLVSFGQAGGAIPPLDIAAFAEKSATVSRPNFGHWTGTRAEALAAAGRLFAALAVGVLRPAAPRQLLLREAATAHRELETRGTLGATILVP